MASLTLALHAARELDPGSLALYALYQGLLRSGWLRRRTPIYEWDARPLADWLRPGFPAEPEAYVEHRATQTPRFFFEGNSEFVANLKHVLVNRESTVLEEADEILHGRFRIFGGEPVNLGLPHNWAAFAPMAGGERASPLDLSRHWATYNLDTFPADVKLLWEGARFGWVYPLARALWLSRDERYAEALWILIESWREANRPNAGPHWMSAQEVALRLMALVFVTYALTPQLTKVPERAVRLAEMVAVHANRIPPTLIYARAQGNNHLLVEAVALYTVGLLFPEFRLAARWRVMGRRWLVEALDRQVFPDGGYIQHSTNYHRLALQAGLWAARLAEINGEPLPTPALSSLRQMSGCLAAMVDPQSGRVPNFGPNDGALILPLSTCPSDDFRPAIQVAAEVLHGYPAYPPGPWDEACVWLGLEWGESSPSDTQPGLPFKLDEGGPSFIIPSSKRIKGAVSPYQRECLGEDEFPGETSPHSYPLPPRGRDGVDAKSWDEFPHAGLYFMRGHRAWGMLRCAQFSSRPGHSDQLHFDLWWRGQNVAGDPGTYLYNGAPPWDNGLAGAGVHNTLVVDRQDPMRRAGRFLWLNWAQGRVLGHWRSTNGRLEVLVAEHHGYCRMGVVHRRTIVRAGDDLWLVVDDLSGDGLHVAHTGWLLPDGQWRLEGRYLGLKLVQGRLKVGFGGSEGPVGVYRAGVLAGGEEAGSGGYLWGWGSKSYAILEPALRLVTEVEGSLPLRMETWWLFDDADPHKLSIGWLDPGEGLAALAWLEIGTERLDINDAHFTGPSGLRHAE